MISKIGIKYIIILNLEGISHFYFNFSSDNDKKNSFILHIGLNIWMKGSNSF